MKYLVYLISVVILGFGCDNKTVKPKKKTQEANTSIIRIIINDEDNVLESEFMYDTLLKQKEGMAKVYHKNGKRKQEGMWHKNKQEGLWVFYDSTGGLESKVNYKDDMQDGGTVIYNTKGVIVEKSNWSIGKLNGIAIEYYEDGLIKRQTNWINGKKIEEKKFPKN